MLIGWPDRQQVAGQSLQEWLADLLVRGAAHLAAAAGVSPLLIGLTVVALGTSAPELAVSLRAALSGQADLTLGNIIGSNIANILLILGLAAIVAPLLISPQLLRREVPMMIGVSLLLWLLAADGSISRFDGAILIALLILSTFQTALIFFAIPLTVMTFVVVVLWNRRQHRIHSRDSSAPLNGTNTLHDPQKE